MAADADTEVVSQADLDAAHENAVATLEEYAEKAHALRDEIVSTEQSLMEQMASIDTCPPSELAGLMARAKKQIAHLFQIKALYLAIKNQEAQLRALVDQGTGKRAPNVAPKSKPVELKPVARKASASPSSAASLSPSQAALLASMNTKLVQALARLESVTARLAKVERRQGAEKKATLVIASQMEKDEKRLNKHARVLKRVRRSTKDIKKRLARLEKSCARGKRAEKKLVKKQKTSKKASSKADPKALKACFKTCKKGGVWNFSCVKSCRAKFGKGKAAAKAKAKPSKARKSRKSRKAARKSRKARRSRKSRRVTPVTGVKRFDLAKCYRRCSRKSRSAKGQCVRVCKRKAKSAARRASRKARKASRPRALTACLSKCRKSFPAGRLSGAKKCALKCFRRHAHRPRKSRKARKNVRLQLCVRQCRAIRSRKGKNARAARARCVRQCQAKYGKSKKGAARRRPNKALKACFKTCRKGRVWNQKCVRSCRAKFGKGKGKKRSARSLALKKCFKTCRKGRSWNTKCVANCRAKYGKRKPKALPSRGQLLKACFKTCRGKSRVVVRGKGKKARRVTIPGKWDRKCVASCRKRFAKKAAAKKAGKPKKAKKAAADAALKACYTTCRGPSRTVIRGKGKKARKVTIPGKWDRKCVARCQKRFGKKAKKAPKTLSYKACVKRCRKGKGFAKCKAKCAKNDKLKRVKVVSPSAKLVKAAIKGLKKRKSPKPAARPETWEDVVRQSRHLLKKTVRLRDLIHRQTARYMDTKDREGRKYNGWWSIWDILKGVKPGKHYTGRAKQIAADVKQIMAPALAKAADGPYGEVVNVLKGADEAFSSKYTRELGSPALDLTVDPKFEGYVEKPLPGAKIRHVPYNPKKPYAPSQYSWKKTPPLSRLPEIVDEDYDQNLKPIYARDFKVRPRQAPRPSQPFDLKTKNWDYPQIPYSYPVTMVKHNPTANNPHVRPPTPGFSEGPEFRFQQTGDSASPMQAPAPADAPKQEAPMTEGTA